ncbi:hypothetical protein KY320_00760 [Candidatus Woesearchaeota archaeon]|nr:hypothetical protein [Candidatus Woesearchaeota archaeon]
MLFLSTALKHYKRKEIQQEIVAHAKDKEIAIKYGDKGFGKRPDTLKYPNDILEAVKQGATSFHASEELWHNPLQLDVQLSTKDLVELRRGWDLVLDIDCAVFEYSRIAADLIVKALRYYKIESVSCKFSGNKGFHIGVPFEAFPDEVAGKKVKHQFPEGARAIALYLKDMIKPELTKQILISENKSLENIAKRVAKDISEITQTKRTKEGYSVKELDVESFLAIDTILISSRHLYRMPYSLHEKSRLVSVPCNPDKVAGFDKIIAQPKNVRVSKFKFLDRQNVKKGEAKQLLMQALDHQVKVYVEQKKQIEVEIPEYAIPEQFFPPCITLGLKGLKDGRKRFMFSLVNFLKSVGWSQEAVEEVVKKWNKKNQEQLSETIILGQLKYRKHRNQTVLPPNCQNVMYYVDMGICKPDNLCKRIKNPVQYSKRKTMFLHKKNKSDAKEESKAKNQQE